MQCVLLDIEGTTSSIRFVYDVMFPYVRQHIGEFLERTWDQPATKLAIEQMARDAGYESTAQWVGTTDVDPRLVVFDEVHTLMDEDVKATGLKQLQGLIWESGFTSGAIKAHVYDDVLPAMQIWHAKAIAIYIYSSGSIPTQKLFFGHTVAGDLLPMIAGHYDTTVGPKRLADSYRVIIAEMGLPAQEVLFISDVVEELHAAQQAGLQTALSIRPENKPVVDTQGHRVIHSFDEL
jgi:enolase-phosphatase E1